MITLDDENEEITVEHFAVKNYNFKDVDNIKKRSKCAEALKSLIWIN